MSNNTLPAQTAHARMVAMLADPHAIFDRSQAVYLMQAAARWSAEAACERVSELNLDALVRAGAEPKYSQAAAQREVRRKRARAEHDTAAVWPWHGDHPRGPVPDWEYEPGRGERMERYNAELKQLPKVRA